MHFSRIILVLPVYLYIICTMVKSDQEPFSSVSESIESFSVDFFKAVAYYNNDENIITSPASAHIVLSMAAFGAGGNTVKEMKTALHLPDDMNVGCRGFQKLLKHLHSNSKTVTLNLANRIYITNALRLKSEYRKLISNSFYSDACEIDIADPKKSVKIINNWVEKNTEHKIHEIITEGDMTVNTQMVLLNAIYFKGIWKHSFIQKSTENRTFHVDNKLTVQVPTMFNYDEYVTGELSDLNARFIVLPYRDSDLSMVIILPHEIDGLIQVIKNFEKFNNTRLDEAGSLQKIYVYLPKFKIESSIHLKEPLDKLGMSNMFTDRANFSGITNYPLLVTKVIQKAFIDVNEEGTEAAAATVSMMVPYSYNPEPQTIIINKPFLFEIIDTRTKMTIFVGAVTNPKKN